MFYMQYLSSLCHRRQWPQPLYEPYPTRAGGAKCVVRVNNREYHTDGAYGTELLARENAAMRAYLICRNFSVNDGMYPSGHQRAQGGLLQGMPVAIGRERHRSATYSSDGTDGSSSSGSRSGGSSPGSDRFPAACMAAEPRRRGDVARVLSYGGPGHRRH